MASLLDLPDFMFKDESKVFNKFEKVFFTIYGLIVGFVYKRTEGKLFCFFMNLFFKKDGKISFEKNLYSKKIWTDFNFYYPNKRIDRIIINHKKHFKRLYLSYCLDVINFDQKDLIIDCGANVGELFMSLKLKIDDFIYVGYEPDPKAFNSLKINLSSYNAEIYDLALSNINDKKPLYLNTEGADSSLIYFGSDDSAMVSCKTLDSYEYKKIKLLKIEAEGGELEVLEGSVNTLKNVEFVSVDYGPERGENKESTSVGIINFLYKNNFKLVNVSKYRQIGLFKNNLFK